MITNERYHIAELLWEDSNCSKCSHIWYDQFCSYVKRGFKD